MQQTPQVPRGFRFGIFEIDLRAGEVRREGLRIKLQEQPFQVLAMLLERAGEVVTREELQNKLWPDNTFVDFDHSLRIAINKIREALSDSAESPRFVETLPKRGYRFIAPVAGINNDGADGWREDRVTKLESEEAITAPAISGPAMTSWSSPPAIPRRAMIWGMSGLLVAALSASAFLYWKLTAPRPVVRLNMTVAPAEQLSGLT